MNVSLLPCRPLRLACRAAREQSAPGIAGVVHVQILTCRRRDIDRYGRIVGQRFLPDGRDITAVMIASGMAREFCRYSGNHYRTC
jgi:micrococcal nuclease